MRTVNKEILDIGLTFCAHTNVLKVTCEFDDCIVAIPFDRFNDFLKLLTELNGKMANILKKQKVSMLD